MSSSPRYILGLDLGTTNSAACYVDTAEDPWRVRVFAVPQLVAPGQVESRETLPSFHYQPAAGEFSAEAMRLPWGSAADHAVGAFARDHGAVVPGRQIASAKSWLCHSGVDRTAPLLPWHGAPDVERLSPVDVSSRYLEHVRRAWDARFPNDPLAEQDFVLTLPASFDEVARELTVKAAKQAGLPRVVLIEEPQAAFYAWIDAHRTDWDKLVAPGQKILVCDVGGGTSDFTLIRVRSGEGGKVQFHRVAVGEHLILGGDNLDLALAHHLERRLAGEGNRLEPRQWSTLVRLCQRGKEILLGVNPPEAWTVHLPGSGARLIGGGLQTEVARAEVRELLLDGFFPFCDFNEKPASRQSGFQEFGLPYAPDPGVTRYLAAFLRTHRHAGEENSVLEWSGPDPARPDVVLFNGGLFESSELRQRLLDAICRWFRTENEPNWSPVVLDNARLDLAVARGAAYYGMVRRGLGVRIAAGLARTYYIGVAAEEGAAAQALCMVPARAEPGQDIDMAGRSFSLLISQPVEFPLFVSSTRLTDAPGDLVAVDREQMTPLPPIRTVLRTSKKGDAQHIPIQLHSRLTEIGTLDLWCSEVGGRQSWRLQFDVRSATQTDVAAHASAAEAEGFCDESVWAECHRLIAATFGPDGEDSADGLLKRLSQATGQNRRDWPTSLLRRIWESLLEFEPGRRRSQAHESRWLNLLGFALRPGYGLAVDDWRVGETWRVVQGKLAHPTAACRNESWTLWRRIAGGLAAGQQQALADPLLATARNLHRQLTGGKGRSDPSFQPRETAELWRMLGSFELLGTNLRMELGNMLVDLVSKKRMEPVRSALAWALGRVGARQPAYGPLNTVVPPDVVGQWLLAFLDAAAGDPMDILAAMQLARRTGDRYRDVSDKVRTKSLDWLRGQNAAEHFLTLVRDGGTLDAEEQDLVFGEALPKGLCLVG